MLGFGNQPFQNNHPGKAEQPHNRRTYQPPAANQATPPATNRNRVPVNTPVNHTPVNQTLVQSDEEEVKKIIKKYYDQGDIHISAAATIMTKMYAKTLLNKMEYWLFYEYWYKEFESMKMADAELDIELWARNFTARMYRNNFLKGLGDVKFELVEKKNTTVVNTANRNVVGF